MDYSTICIATCYTSLGPATLPIPMAKLAQGSPVWHNTLDCGCHTGVAMFGVTIALRRSSAVFRSGSLAAMMLTVSDLLHLTWSSSLATSRGGVAAAAPAACCPVAAQVA
jgi:hypothetical protein